MKKGLAFLTALLLLVLSACGGSSTSTEQSESTGNDANSEANNETEELEPITLRLGHVGPEKSVVDYAAHYFKDVVSEKTDGKITVDIYPNGQLGGDRDMIESVSSGSLSLSIPGAVTMSNFVPAFNGIGIPFLIEDGEMEAQIYKSDLIKVEAAAELENINIKGLAMIAQGFFEFGTVGKPILSLEDAQGVTLRASEHNIMVDSLTEIGMIPTAIAYPEMYSSLETGVVDGGAIPIASWETSGMTEVIDYLTIADTIVAPHPLIMNLDEFNSLPQAYQDAITEAALETEDYILEFEKEYNKESAERIAEMGVEVVEMDSEARAEFVERLQPIYQKYAEQDPWIEKMVNLVEELKK